MEYKGLYITIIPDDGPNAGGYYCQVYEDETKESFVDDFCIHAEQLCVDPSVMYWIKEIIDQYDDPEYPRDPDDDFIEELAYLWDYDDYRNDGAEDKAYD